MKCYDRIAFYFYIFMLYCTYALRHDEQISLQAVISKIMLIFSISCLLVTIRTVLDHFKADKTQAFQTPTIRALVICNSECSNTSLSLSHWAHINSLSVHYHVAQTYPVHLILTKWLLPTRIPHISTVHERIYMHCSARISTRNPPPPPPFTQHSFVAQFAAFLSTSEFPTRAWCASALRTPSCRVWVAATRLTV